NQDGASNGLTAPNGPSQQRVIRQALASAGLSAGDVDVVEAHGTGTALGDPIEAQALLATYGQERDAGRPLFLGSVKSNIGHTQAAAGVAGVIKMVMALEHGVLPRTLHVVEPSSRVDWGAGSVELLTSEVEWPGGVSGRLRRAGVSSFGISGTNAHVVLEEAGVAGGSVVEPVGSVVEPVGSVWGVPWVVSARSEGSLEAQLGRLAGVGGCAVDVGWSLLGRSVFDHRAVVVDGVSVRGVAGGVGPGPVFVFPGQGSQWVGMAVGLLESSEVFAGWMGECDRVVGSFVDWSVVDVLRGDAGLLERIEVLQPVLFSVMVSLAQTWRSFGVEPGAVVGHSQGEIAAAFVAGALSLEDAARIVVLRSRLFADELVGRGAVASVALSVGEVGAVLESWPGLSVAGVNGPGACTVGGPVVELGGFVEWCEGRGVRARVVPSTVASHGPQVEPLRERLLGLLAGVGPVSCRVPFYSAVTGERVDPSELGVEYWYRNAREPIAFEKVTRALIDDGYRVFVESSAHPVLTMSVQATADDHGVEVVAVGSLRRGEGGPGRLVQSLAQAWVAGVEVDWGVCYEGTGARRVDLPTYPFDHRRYWPRTPRPDTTGTDPLDTEFWTLVDNG
ncbi:type I polyketide synthase, partial [Streptomyces pacificus]|uniref:type I polyketide synthase n=1 Tax=Streptomyces pacificus TaxID=2705029 RepID=UPI0015655EF7